MNARELHIKALEAADGAFVASLRKDPWETQQALHAAVDAALGVAVKDLHAMINPELYPGYDPDHIYWYGKALPTPLDDARRSRLKQEISAVRGYITDTNDPEARERLEEALDDLREELASIPPPWNPNDHEPYQWSSDTISWVSEWVEGLRQALDRPSAHE